MSSTAQTIVNRALRLIGVIASGESPTTQESADALTALNAMIDSWQTEKMLVYALVETTFPLVVGTSSYTVGPAGNFALTPRPPKIEEIFLRNSTTDYFIQLVDEDRWFAIPSKSTTSDVPRFAYYEPSMPTGTILLWPVPSMAYVLHIVTWTVISELASLSTTISLPQGYERALAYNLAVDIAPEYQAAVPPTVASVAVDSLAMIKRANRRTMLAYTELGLSTGRRSNIYADQ